MSAARAALLACATACGGATATAPNAPARSSASDWLHVVRAPGRAAIAIVAREGDPSPAVAAFVSTRGIGAARGALVPVAIAGLLESRAHVRATPQADGVRVAIETRDPRDAIARIASALAEPVDDATDVTSVRRKALALAALPRASGDEAVIASCEGALRPPADSSMPTTAELEAWRAASDVRERVAFAVVAADAREGPAMPSGAEGDDVPVAPISTFDPNGAPSVSVVWRGDLRAIGAASALGGARLAAMIAAVDPGARVRSSTSSLSARGACLAVRVDVDADSAARLANVATVVAREARDAIDAARRDEIAWSPDAMRAAEQAAIVALATRAKADDAPSVIVGTVATREEMTRALEDARRAWSTRALDARARDERGQSATWILLASPCGTTGESENDAGASAAFVTAVAASATARGVVMDPWIARDGVGVVARGVDAMALADDVARAFVSRSATDGSFDAFDGARDAQRRLFASSRAGLSALAEALAPGRPAQIATSGTAYALLRLSEGSIAARADALRHGPLRAAILSNDGRSDAIAARMDRWLARGARTCPAEIAPEPPKPGTYAVATDDGTSEAYVAAMIPSAEEEEGFAIASALDAVLLDAALGDSTREHSARVVGPPGSRAIVVHVAAPGAALDAAVAQVRALFDRVRQGALRDEDLSLARARDDAARAQAMRDPRARLVALFRDERAASVTSIDRVRAAAQTILHDDALVIVAARPRAATKRTP